MDFSAFRDGERDGWSSRADIYGDATARATLQTIPKLLDHARLFPRAKVLDAGCGPGYVAASAKLLGADVEGIDFSAGMVERAKTKFPEIEFSLADVEDLPMRDETFDAVLSNIVLFHVTDPERAMSEARRVLKPEGRFVFSQWLGPDRSECYQLLFDVIGRHADMSRADPAPNAYALSNEAQVSEMMQSTSFTDLKAEIVENVLHAPGPSFFEFFMKFGVRVPLILNRQDVNVQVSIREEIDEAAAQYLADGCYKIPMPSIVYSGVAK
ncbi:class I SAM-dependent methyltransferase [Sulfitobacter geojensis]|uniref:Class I SAM-dependent methyltransferase n=1 Tax=Sulfitobacter geojensis TaxID=1342299 RepID=A0AAE2W1M2_9RHOB|nr:class I SAM-dependent methyltransferase [Sulfitobacter geojensis]MBM1691158.1 class I SAM-dependent methyltransferase [Sulfitobacter geojensis]MBM1695224.1 class I SAM-dependent methyltransferase [Sulfitobacter geojensis]MBM1707324.1 class I SAM-dependent methyltransferase [Sulfitobacter geojensis]MBM1711474.1 class I SAM-dependent methyltransferase [Sulfitobacter geojensis]MBM1715449.1 class I SAM-dependent methyltransferase [Sulfitobacter geojensis]